MTHAWLSGPRGPDGQPGHWPLDKDEFILGREAPADLVVPTPRVSRQHARITRTLGYQLADLESRNGTFVNGQPVTGEAWPLRDGDEIVLGGVVTLRFHDPTETVDGPRLGRLKGIWLDDVAREVWVDAVQVEPPLSTAQFVLLSVLYHAPGHVIDRAQIIAAVWAHDDPAGVSEEAVDGLIKRLRGRLRETQPKRDYLEVLRGHGLRLTLPE